MSISLLVLGLSSFLFHASLRHSMQFADELSMLGLAWSILHGLVAVHPSATSTYNRFIKISLAIVFPAFSVFYIWTGRIIYHATGFAIAAVFIVLRSHYLFHWRVPEFPHAKRDSWRVRGRKALVIFLVGYMVWNVDLEYCAELRAIRERVGLPAAWLFELHGWWHVLTAVSAGQFMDIVRQVREEVTRSEKQE